MRGYRVHGNGSVDMYRESVDEGWNWVNNTEKGDKDDRSSQKGMDEGEYWDVPRQRQRAGTGTYPISGRGKYWTTPLNFTTEMNICVWCTFLSANNEFFRKSQRDDQRKAIETRNMISWSHYSSQERNRIKILKRWWKMWSERFHPSRRCFRKSLCDDQTWEKSEQSEMWYLRWSSACTGGYSPLPEVPGTISLLRWASSTMGLVLGTARISSSRAAFRPFCYVALLLAVFDASLIQGYSDAFRKVNSFIPGRFLLNVFRYVPSHPWEACVESRGPMSAPWLPYNYNHQITPQKTQRL